MHHATILDSGFLYATTDKDDDHHPATTETLKSFHGKLILPVTILMETAYLIIDKMMIRPTLIMH